MLRSAWRRLGEPDAINWVTVVVVVVLQTCGSILSAQVDYSERLPTFLALRLLSILALCAVLGTGKVLLSLLPLDRAKPALTILVIIISVGVGSAVFDELLVTFGFATEHVFWRRFGIAVTGAVPAMIVTGILVGFAREIARHNRALSETVDTLSTARAEASRRIADRRQELVLSINAEIDRRIGRLDFTETPLSIAQLSALVDDLIRPLSYKLARDIPGEETAITPQAIRSIPWSLAVSRALATSPIRPLATPLWLVGISAPFLVGMFGWTGVVTAAALLGVVGALNYVAHAVWTALPDRLSVGARGAIFAAILGSQWYGSALLVTALTGFAMTDPIRLSAWAALYSLAAAPPALAAAVGSLHRESTAALHHASADLRRELATLNSAYRQQQKDIARVLHGPVQDAVSAAILRAKASPAAPHAPIHPAAFRRDMTSALRLLALPRGEAVDVRKMVEELSELWSGLVRIEFVASDAELAHLATDVNAAGAIADVVREACSNAIRHGSAQVIRVTVAVCPTTQTAQVQVENDGDALPRATTRGLGTRLFDELCTTWSRRQLDHRVLFAANIPVALP